MEDVNWQIIMVFLIAFLAWNGFLVGILKYLIDRAVRGGDRRLEQLEQLNQKMDERLSTNIEHEADKRRELEREFREFIASLPLSYVHREDWIRLATTIEAKMDSLNNKFDHMKDNFNARN